MAFFIDVLFYTYIAFDHSLLLSYKPLWHLFTVLCTSRSTCTGFATPKNSTQKRTRRPSGLNSPKLCWRACLVFLLQAPVLLAAPLEVTGSSEAGGRHFLPASSTGHKIMGMFRASEKANRFCWAPHLLVLSARFWLVYPEETNNQQHCTWTE